MVMQKPELVLHVTGNKIYKADNSIVYLRGVNFPTFADDSGPDGDNYAGMYATYDIIFQHLALFGFNCVRIMMVADWWDGSYHGNVAGVWPALVDNPDASYPDYRDKVKAFIDAALANNVYVDVSLWTPDWDSPSGHLDVPIPSTMFPDSAAYSAFWVAFAAVYIDYPNVLLECYNEPYIADHVEYHANLAAFAAMATAVRAAGYNHLIVVQWGYAAGFRVDYNGSSPVNPSWIDDAWVDFAGISNIVYSSHLYDPYWLGDHSDAGVNAWLDDVFFRPDVTASVPVIIGETACIDGDAPNMQFFPLALDAMLARGMGFLGWLWVTAAWPSMYPLFTGTWADPTLNWAGQELYDAINGVEPVYMKWVFK